MISFPFGPGNDVLISGRFGGVLVEVDIGISPSLFKRRYKNDKETGKRLWESGQEKYAGGRTNRRRGLNDYRVADAEGPGGSWRNLVDVVILSRRREVLPAN